MIRFNHTHTWGRTYWGGALFVLCGGRNSQADTQKKGVRSALRGILAAGGDITLIGN